MMYPALSKLNLERLRVTLEQNNLRQLRQTFHLMQKMMSTQKLSRLKESVGGLLRRQRRRSLIQIQINMNTIQKTAMTSKTMIFLMMMTMMISMMTTVKQTVRRREEERENSRRMMMMNLQDTMIWIPVMRRSRFYCRNID